MLTLADPTTPRMSLDAGITELLAHSPRTEIRGSIRKISRANLAHIFEIQLDFGTCRRHNHPCVVYSMLALVHQLAPRYTQN